MNENEQLKTIIDAALNRISENAITPEQLVGFMGVLVQAVKEASDRNQVISDETKALVEEAIISFEDAYNSATDKTSKLDLYTKKEVTALKKSITSLLKEVRSIEIPTPEKVDVQKIKDDILAQIKFPEVKETILDDGYAIIEKINACETDDDEYKIDWSHIKNTPDFNEGKTFIAGNRFLDQLVDVDVSGLTRDSLGRYILGSGSSSTAWGAITGTLSAQTDLQAALDAKLSLSGGTMSGDINMGGNDITNINSFAFDTTPTGVTPTEGLMYWNTDDGTLNLGMPGGNVNLQIGQEELLRAKNETGSTILNGKVVYVSGASGNNPLISLADADVLSQKNIIGLATEDIANNQHGYVTTYGRVRDIDTSAWAAGTTLYLSTTAGGLTDTEPTAPAHKIVIGVVIRQHATEGIILVNVGSMKSVADINDINISGIADGDLLQYVSANSRWENKTVSTVMSGYVPYTGATGDVNLGTHKLLTTGDIGTSGSRIGTAYATNLNVSASGALTMQSSGGKNISISQATISFNDSAGPASIFLVGANMVSEDSNKTITLPNATGTIALTSDLSAYQPLDADLTALAALSGTNTIYYRSAANTWTAVTIGSGLDFTTGTLSATGGGGMSIGGSITSATEGSILFAGASGVLAQDNANFFWDDTNNRVGIGTATPSATAHVISTTEQLRLGYDVSNYLSVTVASDGAVTLNSTGAGAGFSFSDPISVTGSVTSSSIIPGSIQGGTNSANTAVSGAQYLASTNTNYTWRTGSPTGAPTAGYNWTSVNLISQSVTEAASGTHALVANLAIGALDLTQGAGSTTNAATVYIEGATTGTATITNSYALWVDDGVTRLDGGLFLGSYLQSSVAAASSFTIFDGGANELLIFTRTASAVNELTIRNAATTAAPSISTSGGDTNINLELTPKGTGKIKIYNSDTISQMEIGTSTNFYSIGRSTSDGFLNIRGLQTTFSGYRFGTSVSANAMVISNAGDLSITGTFSPASLSLTAGAASLTFASQVNFTRDNGNGALNLNLQNFASASFNVNGTHASSIVQVITGATSAAQLRVAYDGSNYVDLGVSSAGAVTLNATGASASFSFSDNVTVPTLTTTANIELGHASDTTISRVSAGVIAVEGVTVPTISSTNTLTNKRITKRTGTTTSSATPTINTDNVDFYSLTAQAVDITSFTTNLSGTPTEGQTLWIAITGTAARAITWGSSFEASTVALPTTTVSTNRLDVGFVWNTVTSKWRCVASC